jgi:transposase
LLKLLSYNNPLKREYVMKKIGKLTTEQIKTLRSFVEDKKGSAKELARAQAIFMLEKKLDFIFIEEITGLKKSAIYTIRKKFTESSLAGLLDKKKAAPRALLKKNQISAVLNVLKNQSPRDFGYDADHWTTSILAHLIKEQYNVQYKTKKPLYLLFKKAKFTFHKPDRQYRNRDQKEIDEWVLKHKPKIKRYLKSDDTVLLTADEMILSTRTTFQKIWLPVNSFPKIDVSNQRKNRSIYGFLNVQNGVQHAFKKERQNSNITVNVLDKICQIYKGKKIVLYWDNAPWHRGKEIKEWLKKNTHRIRLENFPRYAPELNPQEHVWREGRAKITHNTFIGNIDKAADDFVDYLNNTLFRYSFFC